MKREEHSPLDKRCTAPREEGSAQSTAPKREPSIASLNLIKEKVRITLGLTLKDRYQVQHFIDDGTFGRCLLALDLET